MTLVSGYVIKLRLEQGRGKKIETERLVERILEFKTNGAASD